MQVTQQAFCGRGGQLLVNCDPQKKWHVPSGEANQHVMRMNGQPHTDRLGFTGSRASTSTPNSLSLDNSML